MRNLGITIIVALFLLIVVLLVFPLFMAAIIEGGSPSYFFSVICGLFLISGGWGLFRGRIRQGVGLLLLSVVMFVLAHISHGINF